MTSKTPSPKRSRIFVLLTLVVAAAGGAIFWITSDRQWKDTLIQNRQHALIAAAYGGDLAAVRRLVEAGADVNALPHDHREAPLTEAVNMGHEEVVRYLLDHGANPNGTPEGRNPLMLVCWDTHSNQTRLSMARLLLEHGADPNAPTGGVTM